MFAAMAYMQGVGLTTNPDSRNGTARFIWSM
jgi:hypothetical protein